MKALRRWLPIALAVGGVLALLSQVSFQPSSSAVVSPGSETEPSTAQIPQRDPVAVVEEENTQDAETATSVVGAGSSETRPLLDRSANGATTAALYFLELSEELVQMAPEDAGSVQASVATADRADETGSELEDQVRQLGDSVGPGFDLAVAPIKWSVIEVGPNTEYQISIWYVEVFDPGGGADVVASYKTYSASVVWEDGWRLGESAVLPGPTPTQLGEPTLGQDLASRLGAFHDGGGDGPCCPSPSRN